MARTKPARDVLQSLEIHTPAEVTHHNSTEGESVMESVLPYYSDDSAKSKYMSYRACGFTVTEAMELAQRDRATLYRWYREDPEWKIQDTEGIGEFRQTTARNFIFAEYMRNMRLVMEKDAAVLQKALKAPDEMDKDEHAYLRTIRPQYGPSQLAAITAYLKGQEIQAGTINILAIIQEMSNNGEGVRTIDANSQENNPTPELSPAQERS